MTKAFNAKQLMEKVHIGENVLLEVLDLLFDKKESNALLWAISARIPIMIYEKYPGECGDGLLYRALKNIGVPCVRSFQTDCEVGLLNRNCAFYTVYLVGKLSNEEEN